MPILSREEILQANDLNTEEVEVPEWKGIVLVRTMTGSERDELEASMYQINGNERKINMQNLRAKIVALTVVDVDGKRLFNEKDIDALGKKSIQAIERVFSVAQRLNALSNTDIEELTKNSEPGQNEDSISA